MLTIFLLTGLLTAVLPAQAQKSQPPSPALVLDGVTVVDVEQGKLVPEQRVVVVGTRIQAVGGVRVVALPKDAQVIDARGKYLIPGLWDMHTHPKPEMYPLFIANGVTGIRIAHPGMELPDQVRWRRAILDGTAIGPPRQLLAGPPINTFVTSVDGRERLQSILDSLRGAGADLIKVYPLQPDMAPELRKAGLRFGGHALGNGITSPIEASDSGMSILDHVNVSGLSGPCLGDHRSVERCQPVVQTFQRNDTWWVPTLVAAAKTTADLSDRRLMSAESMAIAARLEALDAAFPTKPVAVHGNWLRDSTARGGLPAPRADSMADTARFMALVQRLGLPVMAGSDTPFDDLLAGFSIHAELAWYVAEGFTPLHALQTATLNPAKFLHGTDSLGTVAKGKLADLVLLDADPLADITNTTTIRAVVANGRYFDREALDRLLTR